MRPLRFGLLVSLSLTGSVAVVGLAEARGGFGGARGVVQVRGNPGSFARGSLARRGFVGGAFFGSSAFPRGPGFGPGYGAGPGSIGFGPGYGNSVPGLRGRWDRGFGQDRGRARDFGGDGYGSYGGVYGAAGSPGGVYGRRYVPTLAGIPPTTVRPPAFYRVGVGSPPGGPQGGRARVGGGPLVADSGSAGAPSGVVGSGPQFIRLR